MRARALGCALLLSLTSMCAQAGTPDSLTMRAPLFTRRDLFYAGGAAAAIAAAASNDAWAQGQALRAQDQGSRDAARFAEHLGNTAVVAPLLVAVDLAARATGHPAFGAATERVAVSVGVAGVGVLALKQVFGRARPFESPNDSRDFRPFSGHDAFPSGHSAIAFALAGALGCESKQRWLPFVTYPAATVVAWSRLRDDKHWLSDVTAGAAFGWWTARKAETIAKRRLPRGLWVMVFPGKGGASARIGARF